MQPQASDEAVDAFLTYPWPKGRGTIAAGLALLQNRAGQPYPWPKGRGTIAAQKRRRKVTPNRQYPWPKGRGTLAAILIFAALVVLAKVSMAERPWHNCSQLRWPITTTTRASIHGRKAVAQLQRGSQSPLAGHQFGIHGRKAVAQLQRYSSR